MDAEVGAPVLGLTGNHRLNTSSDGNALALKTKHQHFGQFQLFKFSVTLRRNDCFYLVLSFSSWAFQKKHNRNDSPSVFEHNDCGPHCALLQASPPSCILLRRVLE